MEEILNKNIFLDKDLFKLSPEYHPSDLGFKMEMRRNMINDSRSHSKECSFPGVQRNKSQRKTPKETVRINKELMKLKNEFANLNLRNEVLMKQINSTSTKSVMTKPIRPKTRRTIRVLESELFNDPNDTLVNDYNVEEVIREPEFHVNSIEPTTAITIDIFNNLDDQICNENCLGNELVVENSIKPAEDLQSLLIMMAITTKDCEDEQHDATVKATEINEPLINEAEVDFFNIISIKSKDQVKQEMLIQKYVNKWKCFVETKQNSLARLRKSAINTFFEKLERKKIDKSEDKTNKAKSSVRDYNTYQHRYKMQKHVIALQKAKLDEQNRVIEELKYNKIIEASKHSVDAMKDEVRKTYFEIDRNLKPKIKCLTNELNIQEIEEPSLILHCLKVPQFLQRMEKRAREREEKHAIIRERRRQMEEERIRLKQQAELAKAEMDKEEKMRRIIELRERRKKEKIENIRKKQHAERLRALKVMVDLHYEKNLILRCGIRPWIKLIEMKRENMEKAKTYYRLNLKKNIFLHWMWHTEDMSFDRNYRAEDCYRKKLLHKIFNAFKMNHHEYAIKKQIADDYYDIYLEQLAFRKLLEGISVIKQEYEMKLLKAQAYYNCDLVFKTFTLWRTLPALNALKREQEARKQKWRQKVLQVVPDYTPPED